MHDRYKSSYKYQLTIAEHQQKRKKQTTSVKRSRPKRALSKSQSVNAMLPCSLSPRKTRAWYSKNGDYENPNDILLQTPPTKRYIKLGQIHVEKEDANGWILEMHKCITVKSQICIDAKLLIQSQLNPKFVRSTQPKGLHIAVLRDPNGNIQSAAIINTEGSYIEIKSFATSSKHKRQHLGTLLIAFILERCHGKIIIGARDDFGVLSFWRSIGFIECQQGLISTFGRKGVVMMQTVAPYVGIYEYAISKFAPNSVVKKVLIRDKIRNGNTVKYVEFSLIARCHHEIVINDENKAQLNIDIKQKPRRRKRKMLFEDEQGSSLKRYCTRHSIRNL